MQLKGFQQCDNLRIVKHDLLVKNSNFSLDKCVPVYIANGATILSERVSPSQQLFTFSVCGEGLIKY